MKPQRTQELYERKLARPVEGTGKILPLDHILKQPVSYFPQKPLRTTFDLVEIGPCTGDFLFSLAKQYPQKKIAGVEIGALRFERLKKRLNNYGFKNVTLIFGDARVFFYQDALPSSIEKCFVLFPDPWPRNRHRHLRLLQKEFLEKMHAALKVNGEFTLATDVEDYAKWTLKNLNSISGMENVFGKNQMPQTLPDIIPTFFQKKWLAMGRKMWCLRFRRVWAR